MLTIRREQMQVFDEAARQEWHRHLAASLRETFPKDAAALGPEGFLARIAKADTDALGCKIESRPGIMRFVGLSFLLGEGFHEKPPMQKGLNSPDFSAEDFIREVSSGLPDALEKAANAAR